MRLILLMVSVFLVLNCSLSARILGVFPMDWGSHYILGTKLMRGLANAGHDVTFISPQKNKKSPKNGSWADVVLEGFPEKFQDALGTIHLFDKESASQLRLFVDYILLMSNQTLRHPNVQQLVKSNATFDVVIVDQILNECHLVFAHHFNCPSVILSSLGPNGMVNSKVGNPSPVSTVPNVDLHVEDSNEMTFVERSKNLFLQILIYVHMEFKILVYHNRILGEVFPEAPDIYELCNNVSLVLLNSHTSLSQAVPMVPSMVEIGGYHIDPPQKLPLDIEEFLDSAKEGVIYFSLGSTIKSKDMSENKKHAILNAFGKLKQKVLWKFEEDLPVKSQNILIKNWMPQQDILAHPNIKLFITHGGLLSVTETIYHGVPILTIPVFGDQKMNADKAVQMGIGLKIGYNDDNFDEETLQTLIQELLHNPQYRENAQYRSQLFHDRPMTPMQSAVYWVEYVIRHKGAPHLRVVGVGMPWYKYFMVDVIGVLISALFLLVLIIRYCSRKLLHVWWFTKHDKLKNY